MEDAINQPVKQVVGTINKPMVMEKKKLNKGRPQQAEKINTQNTDTQGH